MHKRGLEIAFGMLFSILIIAAILATVLYVIVHFVRLSNCSQAALFVQDIQEKIDRSWNAEEVRDFFSGRLPSSVTKVCFGSLSGARAKPEYALLARYRDEQANMFLYPPLERCSIKYANLQKTSIPNFFCASVEGGLVKVKLEKTSSENLVSLCLHNATRCSPLFSQA